MKKLIAAAALALMAAPYANATTINFDFTTLGSNNTPLATSVNVNGIVAEGFNNNYAHPAALWLRNVPNDHGLGVCSEGTAACSTLGGDTNEIDNSGSFEAIRLTNTVGGVWTSLWVSSLDADNKDGDIEFGRLLWSDCADVAMDPNCTYGQFTFKYTDFGTNVEGDILALAAAAGFDPTAKYLLFLPGGVGTIGSDNDYLLWRGSIQTVPEPATLGLLGLGLLALGFGGRRLRR